MSLCNVYNIKFIIYYASLSRKCMMFYVFYVLLWNKIRYTYGQPVPGKAEVELCRPLVPNIIIPIRIDEKNPEEVPDYTPPCHKESIEVCMLSWRNYILVFTIIIHLNVIWLHLFKSFLNVVLLAFPRWT